MPPARLSMNSDAMPTATWRASLPTVSSRVGGVVPGRYRVTASHFSWTSRTRYHGQDELQVTEGSTIDLSVTVEIVAQR